MKFWIFTLLTTAFTANVFAQDTTFTRVTTETGTFEQQQIETEADRLFGVKVPARWMVNVHASPYSNFTLLGDINTSSLALGTEFKVTTAYSIGLNYAYEQWSNNNLKFHRMTLEQRWYPKMEKRERNGRAANNFSGTYWGLRTGVYLAQTHLGPERPRLFQSEIRYGIQRRFRKNGLFDYSAGITMLNNPAITGYTNRTTTTIQLNQQFCFGLAVFEKQKETDYSGAYCEVLRCFDDQQRMVKFNTLDLIRIYYQKSITQRIGFSFKPNVSIEQKIGASPFSVEAEADIDLFNAQIQSFNILLNDRGYTFNGAAGLRWYYNQPKRIAAGRSGNNLSGPFVAVRAGYSVGNGWLNLGTGSEQKYTTNSQTISALWGYQLRIFKHGYAAVRVGPGVFKQTITPSPNSHNWKFDLFSDLKVGFAF